MTFNILTIFKRTGQRPYVHSHHITISTMVPQKPFHLAELKLGTH